MMKRMTIKHKTKNINIWKERRRHEAQKKQIMCHHGVIFITGLHWK